MGRRLRGKVKFYDSKKGFGFITPDEGGDDIYFNEGSLPRDRDYDPVEGEAITFEAREVPRGRLAARINFAPTEPSQ